MAPRRRRLRAVRRAILDVEEADGRRRLARRRAYNAARRGGGAPTLSRATPGAAGEECDAPRATTLAEAVL